MPGRLCLIMTPNFGPQLRINKTTQQYRCISIFLFYVVIICLIASLNRAWVGIREWKVRERGDREKKIGKVNCREREMGVGGGIE